MSRHYPPTTDAALAALQHPPDELLGTAEQLDADEDDALTSPRRAEVLERLGVVRLRRGRR